MSERFILHHYAASPFSEKVRLILGFKQLPWASVIVPTMMPKPDVVALTGGYRRTPFLQRGADVWCDSALIARVLEAAQPTPTLYPASAPLAPMLAQWIDTTLFWAVIGHTMQPAGLPHLFAGAPLEAMKAFAADRAPFSANLPRPRGADATAVVEAALGQIERQLGDGRRWLFGDEASIADFSLAHNLWFLRRSGPMAEVLERRTWLSAYADRLLAIAAGQPEKLASTDALLIAAAARTHAPVEVQPGLGLTQGQRVAVAAIDYGTDEVQGELVGLDQDEVAIRRSDERAGTVHVHFPRIGFRISDKDKA